MSNSSNELPSEVIIALRQTFKDTDALDDWAEGDEGGEGGGGGGDIEDAINELLPDGECSRTIRLEYSRGK